MKLLASRVIISSAVGIALTAGMAVAQPPAVNTQPPPPPAAENPGAPPPQPAGPNNVDPRSPAFAVRNLAQRLGLDEKQVAELDKIMQERMAEQPKAKTEKPAAAPQDPFSQILNVLTPEQKEKAAAMTVQQMLRGPRLPGPGETGFRKMQPRGQDEGMMPPGPAGMSGRAGFQQMMRERLAAHADDMIRARASRELGLSSEQDAKVRKIEDDREAAIDKAGKDAEEQFRATLSKEQLEKYQVMHQQMQERMMRLGPGGRGPGMPPAPPAPPADEPGKAK